jgi:hypothetical protein
MYGTTGYVFESLDLKEPLLPFALAEQFPPSLVVA